MDQPSHATGIIFPDLWRTKGRYWYLDLPLGLKVNTRYLVMIIKHHHATNAYMTNKTNLLKIAKVMVCWGPYQE